MKAIIFDLDGTLIDSTPTWMGTGEFFLKKYNYKIPNGLTSRVKSQTIFQTAKYFVEELGVLHTYEEVANEILSYVMGAYESTIPLKPFVYEYLQKEFSKGTKMCILTASEISYVKPLLKRLDILKFFDFILTCTEVGEYKHDKKVFEIATARLGVNKNAIVVFEDSLYAIKGAKKGDFKVIAVDDLSMGSDKEEIIKISDKFIKSFEELL